MWKKMQLGGKTLFFIFAFAAWAISVSSGITRD
jgi:hypothetical protein